MSIAASNEYAQKVYEAYLKFEAVCKELGITSVQSEFPSKNHLPSDSWLL